MATKRVKLEPHEQAMQMDAAVQMMEQVEHIQTGMFSAAQEQDNELERSEMELLSLLGIEKIDQWAETLSYDDLMKLTFQRAHEVIMHLSMKRRIQLLLELEEHLQSTYKATELYTADERDLRLSPQEFLRLMNKIKHIECIRTWLFGID